MPAKNINTEMTQIDDYFKSAISVDCVILGFDANGLKVLVIKSQVDPFIGMWTLLGDLIHPSEHLHDAAKRVLNKHSGMGDAVYLEQVEAFGNADRHPLGRVITIAYYSLVKLSDYDSSTTENSTAVWKSIDELGKMGFDHNEILVACIQRLRRRVRERPIGFDLLPHKFTLTQLQSLYEAVLGEKLDKRNFRKKIISMNLLVDLKETQKEVAHRPAKLYKFDEEKYKKLESEGFSFEL